jgi:hypothetical protein
MADTLIREGVAYGSQPLSPVPQYWDGVSGYEKVRGVNGAIRAILFDSAGETFTDSNPGSVTVISSAGGSAVFNPTNPASVKLTATSTVTISGISTVIVSGTATVNFSGNGTVEIVSSAGGTAYFSRTNPGNMRAIGLVGTDIEYSATITWSSGTTATSSQTLTVGVITASITGSQHIVHATNDGPYAITLNLYENISANGSSFISSAVLTLTIPAETVTAGITINAARSSVVGNLFGLNKGLTFRFTATAAFTATVTNNILINSAT